MGEFHIVLKRALSNIKQKHSKFRVHINRYECEEITRDRSEREREIIGLQLHLTSEHYDS